MRTDDRVDAALAGHDIPALTALAQAGVDLNDVALSTDAGPRTLLDQVLRLGDPDLAGAVLALPGVSPARSLPRFGYWAWAADAPLPVVQTFIEHARVDPAEGDADGRTLLLEVAAGGADLAVITWLLGRLGAGEADRAAADGTTPFFHAAVRGHLGAAAALHRAGANPNVANRLTGWTALVTAVASGLDEVVRWLLALPGLDVNRADAEGATALHVAARLGAAVGVEALMAHPRADLTAQDALGRTPLMDAARHANVEVAGMLLGPADAGVNLVDADRRTALHHAVAASAPGVARLLLDRPDINLAITDRPGGLTALELARAAGDDRLAGMIEEAARHAGTHEDRPANQPPPRPPAEDLDDLPESPGIADPPLTIEGS